MSEERTRYNGAPAQEYEGQINDIHPGETRIEIRSARGREARIPEWLLDTGVSGNAIDEKLQI